MFKENQSEGPITNYANMLVALNNLWCVVVFEVLFACIMVLQGKTDASLAYELGKLALELFGAVGLGFVAGVGVSFGCAVLGRRSWLVMLIAATTLILGLTQQWQIPYLLTFLVMGATVANTSDRTKDVVFQLDELTGLLCVVFFVVHGAEMDLRALVAAGMIGLGYITLRAGGKYFGIYLSATRKDGKQMRRWLGATLMSQAGAAIALSAVAVERYPELGHHLMDVILGTVIVFELAGPLLIRQAVIRSGEAPLTRRVHRRVASPRKEIRALANRLLMAIGADPWRKRDHSDLRVSDIMRSEVYGIHAGTPFGGVRDAFLRSHEDTLAVVDAEGAVIGIIRYQDLHGEYFDLELGALVNAEDLALDSFPKLHPEDSLYNAWREFQKCSDDSLPVVTKQKPHRLAGTLWRRDVLRFSPR